MSTATFRIWRGNATGGGYEDYTTDVSEGMVVLDAVHEIQATKANDMAVRWNCKAGKCGSCSAEINGNPKLMCMTRLSSLPLDEPVTIEPIRSFPVLRDLVTDVSWNYEVKKRIKPFKPRPLILPTAAGGWLRPTWIVCRSSASASSVFCVRTCVTCCVSTPCTTGSSGLGSSCTRLLSRCTRWTPKTAPAISPATTALATAI